LRWRATSTGPNCLRGTIRRDRIPACGTLNDITFDYLADTDNINVGSPRSVTEKLISLYEQAGGFGVLNLHTAATMRRLISSSNP
jgi:hypothetical protein